VLGWKGNTDISPPPSPSPSRYLSATTSDKKVCDDDVGKKVDQTSNQKLEESRTSTQQ